MNIDPREVRDDLHNLSAAARGMSPATKVGLIAAGVVLLVWLAWGLS